MPEGSLAGKEVSGFPERNKALQLTRVPLMEKKDDERVLVKKSEMRNSSGRKYGVFVVTLTI